MKNRLKQSFAVPVLVAALGSLLGQAPAHTFTTLHSFATNGYPPTTVNGGPTNLDGASPRGGLALYGNTLYGTTYGGGSGANGTVFAVNTDGTDFRTLHDFAPGWDYNDDGLGPQSGLILSGNTLYGVTTQGTRSGGGSLFAINMDGTGFTTLHDFSGIDGYALYGQLVLLGSTLYGITCCGGSSWGSLSTGVGYGSVFAVNTEGTGLTTLYNFTGGTNGFEPESGLVLSGYTLYGTTHEGGSEGSGSVFRVNTDGTGFRILYSFTATSTSNEWTYGVNNDGAYPALASLTLSGSTLYGITPLGGRQGYGTVFALNTDVG
jgi:uncharacterized repeat protein (TIGR03803 family)